MKEFDFEKAQANVRDNADLVLERILGAERTSSGCALELIQYERVTGAPQRVVGQLRVLGESDSVVGAGQVIMAYAPLDVVLGQTRYVIGEIVISKPWPHLIDADFALRGQGEKRRARIDLS